jgi:prophage regulatory protein
MPDPNPSATENPDPDICPFLRMWAVTRLTGLGRSTIYRLVAQDKFPSPVRLSNRTVAWRRTDLERWTEGRPTVAH